MMTERRKRYKVGDKSWEGWKEYGRKNKTKINRSRLDFFIVSKGISHLVKKCNILPNTQS
jgi:hypothetical protein